METSEKISTNGLSKHPMYIPTKKTDGLNNWMLILFIIFCANFVVYNVLTQGIIKSPIELTYDVIGFMQINWWCYVLMFSGYLFQIFLCYLNEKCLAMGILPGNVGMVLHVFIALISFNLCSILCLVYKFNPVAGVVAMTHIFLLSVKFWSYAYENKKLREAYKRSLLIKKQDVNRKINSEDAAEMVNKSIKYPENVTLKRTYKFLACTSACVYRIDCPLSKRANYKKVLKGIILSILNCYTLAFFIYQFIFPEIFKAVSYIDSGQYLNLFGSILKLVVPVHITWLLFFYFYCFEFYLPMFSWFWGTEYVIPAQDWWNSENSKIFWSKWNCQVHMWLKKYFFLPTLQMGYSKRTAAFVVGLVSGFLHEYLITVPCRCCYGLGTVMMLVQIPLEDLTALVQRKYGDKWGNIVLWLFLMIGHSSSIIFIYYRYLQS